MGLPRFWPPSNQGSPPPSSPPLDKPALSGLLLVPLPLLLVQLPSLQGHFLVCPASPHQAADLLTKAALSTRLWLDPTGEALFPAVALRLPAQASPVSLECP